MYRGSGCASHSTTSKIVEALQDTYVSRQQGTLRSQFYSSIPTFQTHHPLQAKRQHEIHLHYPRSTGAIRPSRNVSIVAIFLFPRKANECNLLSAAPATSTPTTLSPITRTANPSYCVTTVTRSTFDYDYCTTTTHKATTTSSVDCHGCNLWLEPYQFEIPDELTLIPIVSSGAGVPHLSA